MPIAIMLASIMTFGNMGEHFELTAAKSAGISLLKIMRPFFWLALFFSTISFLFANYIFPYASLNTYTLIASIRQQHPMLRLQEGIFNYDVEGYVIRIGKKNPKTLMMYDFMIYDHINYQGNKFVIVADSGTVDITQDLKYMIITLYNGSQYEELKDEATDPNEKKYPYHQDFFDKQTIIIPLKGFDFKETDMSLYQNNYNMLNISQLQESIDSLTAKYVKRLDYYQRIILNNDLLKNQIKLRTNTDSVNFQEKVLILNKILPEDLTVFYNIDSAFNSQTLHDQKEITKIAQNFAENLYNRVNVFKAEADSRRDWLVQHKIAFHKKFVFSIACLLFFFIGAPLGAIIRKGGFGLPTIVSVTLILVFYVILTLGEKIARDGGMSPFVGIWLAVFIFVPFEIYLFYKAATDAVIVNYDYYADKVKTFVRKITPNFMRQRQYRKIRKKLKNTKPK